MRKSNKPICHLLLVMVSLYFLQMATGSSDLEACGWSEDSGKRRFLTDRRYISYDTLIRDLVPCDRAGASYYNCRGDRGVANFYNRGCQVITRCARGD